MLCAECEKRPVTCYPGKGLCNTCYSRRYYHDNADHRARVIARATDWRKANPERYHELQRKSDTKRRQRRKLALWRELRYRNCTVAPAGA